MMAAMWLFLVAMATTTLFASGDNNTYVVVAPSKLRAGVDFAVSVNILRATSDVTVTAKIQDSSKSDVATASAVFKAGAPKELSLKIPDTLTSSSFSLVVSGTGGLTFTDSISLGYTRKLFSLFIQSDKAIYKPGDTVNFRVFGAYSDLKPYLGPIDIDIFDGSSNKMKQWLQATPTDGVITKSFKLSTQPTLGDWKISVTSAREHSQKVFTVAEYVLPKFEVDVVLPSYVLSTDSTITALVKAKYTYGKPVKGTVDVMLGHLQSYQTRYPDRLTEVTKTMQVSLNGETKVSFLMSDVKAEDKYLTNDLLYVVANVTEEQTGRVMSSNSSVKIYDKGVKLDFPDSNPETFKPGLKYIAMLQVSQPDGLPANVGSEQLSVSTSVTVELPEPTLAPGETTTTPKYPWMVDRYPKTKTEKLPDRNITVPADGLVAIPLEIRSDARDVSISAQISGVSKTLSLGKSHSPSNSYMQLDLLTKNTIQAGDTIDLEVTSTQPLEQLVYQVMSRGRIVQTGTVSSQQQRVQPFTLTTDETMAPDARIVVYFVRADGEIVTDSISFSVSGIFANKVSVQVDSTEAKPGDNVKVNVAADPASVAHLMAIDQSVLLLKSGNDVTSEDVTEELKSFDSISTSSSSGIRGGWWGWPVFYGGSDAQQILENSGVKVLTDCLVYHYEEPYQPPVMFKAMAAGGRASGLQLEAAYSPKSFDTASYETSSTETSLRTNFAETWLWSDMSLGANGSVTTTATIPDTITSWVISAFATNSNSGLGVAPSQAKVTVFKPFFVSLNLPYSVTRGEQVALQAVVFNYLEQDASVRVTLSKSNEFFNIVVDSTGAESLVSQDMSEDITIKAGESSSVFFPIVPADLGHIDIEVKAQTSVAADALRRQLLVEAEGVPKEYSVPVLIDLTNDQGGNFTQTVDLTLPATTVQGSQLVKVSAVGDLMGPSVAGLDSLLRMPTGCGEQTMIGLAPNVYVTDYLKAVNQLTSDIEAKALGFMESGYQRELTYKHDDGSISAFGKNDDSGSMWLTAFVTRVFHEASPHIFVDENVMKRAINWMVKKQSANGSFPEPGRVIHKGMQGEAGQGMGLTCFVYISLLENQDLYANDDASSPFNVAKAKALFYLETEVANTDDVYVQAMAAYAFTLAGSSQAQVVLDKLEAKAVKDGKLRYWRKAETSKTNTGSWHSPHSTRAVDTEMSAYVLLAYAARSDVVSGTGIMQWLAQQRNPHGGFSSTQDTVVALSAMSEFAKMTKVNDFNLVITAQLDSAPTFTFNVDQTNALLLQTKETKTVPSKVKIDASGRGMALVQTSVFYNVESEVEDVTFELTVTLLEEMLNWLVVETCTRWIGDEESSAMAVQEIGIPSGFSVDPEDISRIKTLKRIETENKKVILYFDQIGLSEVCLTFKAERIALVAKSQPASVRVYDYYEPGNQVTAFYQSQILKDSTVCEVCKECCH